MIAESMKSDGSPRILKVETGWLEKTDQGSPAGDFIDYRVYDRVPKWWRRIEQLLRVDLYLAYRAKAIADQYDIIWANSEKAAIPLSFLNIGQPLVVVLQYPESPLRMLLIKLTGIAGRWDGVGIVSKDAREMLQSELGVDPAKIFQYYAARTDLFQPVDQTDGQILSMGVAKRDYETMIRALTELPGYQTEIFLSSRYGDHYCGKIQGAASWIRFPARITDEELRSRYQHARFVVVPLRTTSHSGAGVTSVFEASASGKAVIATDTGGMNSYIVHGKTGLLVPPGDTAAMRDAIRTLWENPELAREMGKAGREFVEQHYSYDRVEEATSTFLKNLWERSSR